MTAKRHGGSFRDPSGFIFQRDGILYRQVNQSYGVDYRTLLESGLYEELTGLGLLIPHEEVSLDLAAAPDAFRILQPELIPSISYPYEWCFGQLQDAALVTLEIQRRALARGMVLKDASAYNIQFRGGRPVMIDTLSFEVYSEGEPWVAYRQFCQHFLAPLLLMARRDIRLAALLRQYLDGVPLDLASRLLSRRTWLRFSTLLHVHLHARALALYAAKAPSEKRLARSVSRTAMLGLVESLEGAVRRLSWKPTGTEWAEYADELSGSEYAEEKKRLVRRALNTIRPAIVLDLGANTGEFSRLAIESGARVLSVDGDAGAVERHFRAIKTRGREEILPLLADLVNPASAGGWAHEERASLLDRASADLTLALALVHHLAISNNVPLQQLARFFARCAPTLIIEWVPKGDRRVEQLLAGRRDVFPEYTREGFERAFGEVFEIVAMESIADSSRVLYWMKVRG